MCDSFSIAFSATTICIVVQFGLAMIPRGRFNASSGFTSGTTKGMSASIRNALELSIITAPYLVIVSANSFDVPAPAEVKAMSTPLKSSLCCSSFTSISFPRNVYFRPALREEPNNNNSSIGKFLSSSTRRNSCPTAPLAPTIATFISYNLLKLLIITFFLFCRRFSLRFVKKTIISKRCVLSANIYDCKNKTF